MMHPEFAKQFAREWVEAWNDHDLDRVLAHYAEDFEMSCGLSCWRCWEGSTA